MLDQTLQSRCFKNLQLSFRGAERQAPHVLSLALTFSKVMQGCADDGTHPSSWNTSDRLHAVIQSFNDQDGVLSKWAIDDEKEKAVLNLLIGTSPCARQIISGHLAFNKWRECSFSSELLKNSRWLLNAVPKGCKEPFKQLLVVDSNIQEQFLRNHIAHFAHATRKIRASAKSKQRASVQDWERCVNYTCIMEAVKKEVKIKFEDDTTLADAVVARVNEAFMSRSEFANKNINGGS